MSQQSLWSDDKGNMPFAARIGLVLPTHISAFLSGINVDLVNGTFTYVPLNEAPNLDAEGVSERPLSVKNYPQFKEALPALFEAGRKQLVATELPETVVGRAGKEQGLGSLLEIHGFHSRDLSSCALEREWYQTLHNVGKGYEEALFHQKSGNFLRSVELKHREELDQGALGIGFELMDNSCILRQWVDYTKNGPVRVHYYLGFGLEFMPILRSYLNLLAAPLYEVALELTSRVYTSQQFSIEELREGIAICYRTMEGDFVNEILDYKEGRMQLPPDVRKPDDGAFFVIRMAKNKVRPYGDKKLQNIAEGVNIAGSGLIEWLEMPGKATIMMMSIDLARSSGPMTLAVPIQSLWHDLLGLMIQYGIAPSL